MKITEMKLSQLIRHALADLELVEQDEDYTVSMGVWHAPYNASESYLDPVKCDVCLAGAVMAKSLDMPINTCDGPEYFSRSIGETLEKLNFLRMGQVSVVFIDFSDDYKLINVGPVPDREIVEYSIDPPLFKAQMGTLASELETAGY